MSLDYCKIAGKNNYDISSYTYAVMVLYCEEKCLGRIKASRILGLPERLIRRILDELVTKDLLVRNGKNTCISEKVLVILPRIHRVKHGKYWITSYNVVDTRVLKNIKEHVTGFRDLLLLHTGDPRAFEVIGVMDGELVFPGVPDELSHRYSELISNTRIMKNREPGIVIVWNNYKPFIYDGYVLDSICRLG